MKKSFRLSAIVLAVVMLAGALASCSQDGPQTGTQTSTAGTGTQTGTTTTEPVRDPIVLKVLSSSAEAPGSSAETAVGEVIKEKFNIEFEYLLAPTNYDEQLGIWLAGGDYPEIVRLSSNALLQQYIDAGALICLEDYLDDMPNFTEKRASQIPYWRSHAADGKLYKWENASPESPEGQRDDFDVVVRTDLLEQQGWPELITVSQYMDFMSKALKDNPKTDGKNTIGMTFAGAESWGVTIPSIMFEKGDRYFHINQVVVGNIKDYRFDYKWELPETKESLKFFNDMYLEGLLDKEAFSLTGADVLAKMTTGQPAVQFYARWNAGPANAGLSQAGLEERQYIELPIQLDSQANQKRQLVQQLVRPLENMVMTKNCKNPDRVIELLDWWQTDEAQLMGGSGMEGVDYEIKEGKRTPIGALEEYLKGNDAKWPMRVGQYESGLFSVLGYRCDNYSADGQPFRITKDPGIQSQYGLTERQRAAYEALGWDNYKSWYSDNGDIHYDALIKGISIDPASDLGKNVTMITELAAQYSSKLVFAKSDAEFETVYSQMLTEMSGFNPKDIVDEYNRLLAEKKAAIG